MQLLDVTAADRRNFALPELVATTFGVAQLENATFIGRLWLLGELEQLTFPEMLNSVSVCFSTEQLNSAFASFV
jgi:hypothetical protein